MLFTHCTYLRIVNNTSSAMRITVDETDNFDWDRDGNSRPDINFQNVSIGAYQSKKEREELNALARSSWYRMHITLSNGNSINFRNDQYDARRPNERNTALKEPTHQNIVHNSYQVMISTLSSLELYQSS